MKQRMTFIFDGQDDGTSEKTFKTMTKAQKDTLAVQTANILALGLVTMCMKNQDQEADEHNVKINFYVESAEHLED